MDSCPDGWKIVKISEVFTIKRGRVLATTQIRSQKTFSFRYPVYSSQTLNNGLMGYYDQYNFENAITWTTDGANAGTTRYRAGKFYATNVCGVLSSSEGFANLCMAEIINRETPKYVSYVGNPKLMSNVVADIIIPLPPLPEQQAIADTLTVFDTHITNLANLVAKKKAIRDGALDDLMSARTRLKGFSGQWEVVLLGSKCEITSSKRVFESEWKTSGIPFLRTRDIANFHAGIEGKDKLFISEDTYKEKISVSGEVKEGDLLVTGVGTIGLPFIIATNERLYFKDGNILWLKRSKDINTKFLYYLFLSKDIQQQINDACGFTTVGTLTIQNAKKLQINLPPLPEQQAIADTLTAFDDEINALESERGKIIQIRDGAMNDLLTGKVRLLQNLSINSH